MTNIQNISILLIEDDEDDMIITQELLRDIYGDYYSLEWANNPDAALDILENASTDAFDVCLVDYRLGKTDGLEIIRKIAQSSYGTVPAILLTGVEDKRVDMMAMEAGATDFLVKHQLSASTLERSIRYAINKSTSDRHIHHLAYHDPLTNLPNRLLLKDRLEQIIASSGRHETVSILMFLDLDDFKKINDSLGHSVGDHLLTQIAKRLKNCLRRPDTVARVGGDEFVILLPDLAHDVADAVAKASIVTNKILTTLATPVFIGETELHVSGSIGMTILQSGSHSVDTALRQADTAMYEAKAAGRNTWRLFLPDMEEAVVNQLTLENRIRSAIKNREFSLYYQPILDLETMELAGAEALIRWNVGKKGFISPVDFIPVAESVGLILPLGDWILGQACAFLANSPQLPSLAVNISSEQFRAPNFIKRTKEIVTGSGVDPTRLIFELTETSMLADVDAAAKIMDEIRDMGIQTALDDFGTGYSSLAYLKRLPFDTVKVDHSFTSGLVTNANDQAIVEAVLTLGIVLGLKVTVEGVETKEQLKFLQRYEGLQVQGHLFSPAVSARNFNKVTQNNNWAQYLPPFVHQTAL